LVWRQADRNQITTLQDLAGLLSGEANEEVDDNMKKILLTSALILVLTLGLASLPQEARAEEGPTAELKKAVDEVLAIIADESISGPGAMKKKLDLAWEVINKYFADGEMTRRVMAKHWKKRTDEEKKEMTHLFSELLRRSYLSRLELFEGQELFYDKERIDGEFAKIESHFQYHGERIPLGYSLHKIEGKWMLYDMIIDGVSLIANYRRQFGKIIRKEGYKGLVKRLETKLAEEEALEDS
jgi:phospholipid transport system substrate-binding protein